MAYCRSCGALLVNGAKFCQKCGCKTDSIEVGYTKRQQEFVGKLYKCPRCGEVLDSFVRNCPACGLELRGAKASSAVKEFALKLEAIESRREYERPSFFSTIVNMDRLSKADEQKMNLIQNFSVPNTKEDMLEFMILATSNINLKLYDYIKVALSKIPKSEKAINDAWISKMKQVYEKAKLSYGTEKDFLEIQRLYNNCNSAISRAKRNNIIKLSLVYGGWIPLFILIGIQTSISNKSTNAKEEKRLEAIVIDIEEAQAEGDYKLALLNAESIEYNGYDNERERWWGIKKEVLIDDVIEEAEKNGQHLERTPDKENDEETEPDYSTHSAWDSVKEGYEDAIHSDEKASDNDDSNTDK